LRFKRARASCPLSRSPPEEGQISDDTSESFSSESDSDSDSSSSNSSNTTVIEKEGETKSKPGDGDGDGDVLLLNDPSSQFVDDDVVEVDRVDNANSSARAAPTDQDPVGPTDVDNDVGVAVEYESEDNCSGDDDPGEASMLPTPHFLHVFSGSLPPQLSTQSEIRLLNQRQTLVGQMPQKARGAHPNSTRDTSWPDAHRQFNSLGEADEEAQEADEEAQEAQEG
jgi:hypothetical protein